MANATPREYVDRIEFGVFSAEEIKRFAVVNVTDPAVYSASLPVANGTADHRMGSVDRRLLCGTCKHCVNQCPGHAGMIALNYPVLHPSFSDFILKLLKVTCFFCSELLLSDADRQLLGDGGHRRGKSRKQLLVEAVALAKNKKACLHCAGPVPAYTKQGVNIRCDFSKCKFADQDEQQYCQRPFTAAEVRLILNTIRDDNCALLGLNPKVSRPENFVLTAMVVPPPIVRPSVVASEGSRARGQDDLTGKICDIIKANANVKLVLDKEVGSIPRVGLSMVAQQVVADLAFHVSTFINNEIRGQRQSVQRNGQPTRSIISRLKGKEGRIRGFLMGKRVDFSARSVISPDSQMDLDQVGIPEVVASKLTVPMFVLETNLELMRSLVRGPSTCARAICRGGRCEVVLEFADREREAKQLKVGDVVERTLQNDDIVLFNRQPSLHKGSMMGYRALICKGSRTFRLNLACTGVSNADYDGDEMNVHAPQDPAAQAEARLLMSVPEHIVSAQSNKPSIGLVQDTLVGAWLLTDDATRLTRQQFCALRLCLHYSCRTEPVLGDVFTGKQAFSLLLPSGLDYENEALGVLISSGQLVKGRLCRKTLGTASGSLVHFLWLFQGAEVAKRFLSDAQRLVNRWLAWRGFSVRLSDCEPDQATTQKLCALVELVERKAAKIAEDAGLRDSPPEMLEEAISTIANKALTNAGKIVHASLSERSNALYQDVASGAKGNLVNITQLLGIVGQQSVEGQRVDPGAPLSAGLARKGFVKHPYFVGLDAREFFAHTMAGREGLIDTSVKTASTGYLQRRLMKAMETLTVAYDGTCRNSRQTIVQFEYGGDGYDATYLVRQSLDVLRLRRDDVAAQAVECERGALMLCWDAAVRARTRFRSAELDVSVFVPVPLDAMLRALPHSADAPLHEEAHARAVDSLCARVCRLRHGHRTCLELLLRWQLRAGNVRGRAGVPQLLDVVERSCVRAEVAPGEAVGPLASTSIGEPLTQLTLNTFHMAGVKAKNVTLGVPRIKELIDCTKNPKTPSMTLTALPSYARGDALDKLLLGLHDTRLSKAVLGVEFLDEPDFFASERSPLDAQLAARERLLAPEPPGAYGAIVARLVLEPRVLIPRGLSPADVAELLERHCQCHVSASEELHEQWLLRVRFTALTRGSTAHPAGSAQEAAQLRTLTEELVHRLCRDVSIGGIPGVHGAAAQADQMLVRTEQGPRPVPCTTIVTQGSNLQAALAMPQLCAELCTSNDVHEVLGVLGVEAATALLFEQIQYTLQFDGSYVNERHLLLLVSFMTCLGGLLPVSRHGINKLVDSGPLARASFEEVADRLAESAVFGDVDPVLCHSARIMVGEPCRVGTGVCDVEVDAEPAPVSDAETDDVVFTMLDASGEAAPEQISCQPSAAAAIEMPFREDSAGLPKVLQASYIRPPPADAARSYEPSSPKTLANDRKRRYEPSSPKVRIMRARASNE